MGIRVHIRWEEPFPTVQTKVDFFALPISQNGQFGHFTTV
jgi:hypothetical protein